MNGDEIRIAVISDTHGLLRRCVTAEVQDCDCILHAGDIIRESDLDELAVLVHDRRDVPRDLQGVNAVIYGHSHRYSEEWTDGRLWLNPGSCGRARFGSDVTMAKIILRGGKIHSVKKIEFTNADE